MLLLPTILLWVNTLAQVDDQSAYATVSKYGDDECGDLISATTYVLDVCAPSNDDFSIWLPNGTTALFQRSCHDDLCLNCFSAEMHTYSSECSTSVSGVLTYPSELLTSFDCEYYCRQKLQ